jgi:hypothetical protein
MIARAEAANAGLSLCKPFKYRCFWRVRDT